VVCRRRGYRFICVTDPDVSSANLRAVRAYGAPVVVIDQPDGNGGYPRTRIVYIEGLLASDPRHLWRDQYACPANPVEHYDTTAREILAEFPRPDYVFCDTGSTGTRIECAAEDAFTVCVSQWSIRSTGHLHGYLDDRTGEP